MLENLFGNALIEKILFYLLQNERAYALQLTQIFGVSLFSTQRALAKLEKGGILVSQREGKTLMYQLNPRYPFLPELKAFLQKAYSFLPKEFQDKFYEPLIRKRPRRAGKPL